jgi:hypothetical protein
MKDHRMSRNMAPPIPNLLTGWKRVVNFTPQLLYPKINALVPTDGWVDLRGCLDGFGEERISPAPPPPKPAASLILETVRGEKKYE